ncbi:unnamed protein product [Closterium sp. NIES-54]
MAALRIEEDEAVEEGVHKFFDLFTRLEGADLNYSELQKKTKLLALLPESWSSLIINLNRDLPHLSLEDVKRAILQEDFRRRELASADGAGAASIGQGWSHAKSWPHLAKKRGTASGGARGSGGMERFMTTKLSTEELRQAIAKLVVTCDFPFQKVESEAVSVPCLVFWQYVVDYFMLLL